MRFRDTRQRERFNCPKLGAIANLTFDHREHFVDESDLPVEKNLIRHDCDGRLSCGITPRVSVTMGYVRLEILRVPEPYK